MKALFKGFCVGVWTALAILMNSYSYINNEREMMYISSILLMATFFAFGLALGEFNRNKKVRGEIKK